MPCHAILIICRPPSYHRMWCLRLTAQLRHGETWAEMGQRRNTAHTKVGYVIIFCGGRGGREEATHIGEIGFGGEF